MKGEKLGAISWVPALSSVPSEGMGHKNPLVN